MAVLPPAIPTPWPSPPPASIEDIDNALPQTQCTRCGYQDCRAYAQAIAGGQADINRCPPGGQEGVHRLAQLTGRTAKPLNPECGDEGPLKLALIDEAWCIGCTLCLDACPVDAITGSNKWMHTVIAAECTGCELCLPACPVDCIQMVNTTPHNNVSSTGSGEQARRARERYAAHQQRLARRVAEQQVAQTAKAERKLAHLAEASQIREPDVLRHKRALIEEALQRARARRSPP